MSPMVTVLVLSQLLHTMVELRMIRNLLRLLALELRQA